MSTRLRTIRGPRGGVIGAMERDFIKGDRGSGETAAISLQFQLSFPTARPHVEVVGAQIHVGPVETCQE